MKSVTGCCTVSTVSGAFLIPASRTAHSRALWERAEPSVPTRIPRIYIISFRCETASPIVTLVTTDAGGQRQRTRRAGDLFLPARVRCAGKRSRHRENERNDGGPGKGVTDVRACAAASRGEHMERRERLHRLDRCGAERVRRGAGAACGVTACR